MNEYYETENNQISIGEMAEIFGISSRTLRLYHDMGLLTPQYVNEQNGYRYYSSGQFQRLEKIIQMKSIGFSLNQIKTMLQGKDLSLFEAMLNERIDKLNEKIAADTAARDLLIKQLNSCAHMRNPPVLDSPFIEFIPKRPAFTFNIEPYDLRCSHPEGSPWEEALSKVRSILLKNHLPTSLLHNSCCTISRDSLIARNYLCDGVFLLTDKPVQSGIAQRVIQSGTYACLYRNYIAMDSHSETVGLDELLGFIEDNHYQIMGPYLGEVIVKMSIFDYSNNNILVKLQIPVKILE